MATILHEPSRVGHDKPRLALQLLVAEMWAALAIIVMWLAVLFVAIFGPDIVSRSFAGDTTTVPSAVVLALFAFLGTWVVARYGFRHEPKE